jgi:uncharacterized protein YecT (DUF1311 family)
MRPKTTALVLACIIAGLKSSFPAETDDCGSENNQRQMNLCFDHVRQVAEEELIRTYQSIFKITSDKASQQTLRDSQRGWITYRDKWCEFQSSGVRGGTVYPTILAICLTDKIRARNEELKRILKCEEGDLSCPR